MDIHASLLVPQSSRRTYSTVNTSLGCHWLLIQSMLGAEPSMGYSIMIMLFRKNIMLFLHYFICYFIGYSII